MMEEQWIWMMDYCRRQSIPCAQTWAWEQATDAYERRFSMPVKQKGDKVVIEQADEFTAEVKRHPRKKDSRKKKKKQRGPK